MEKSWGYFWVLIKTWKGLQGYSLATIKVVHEDVEEKQFSNGLVKIWLQNLKDTTHELKDIMNKYVYEELCLEHEEVKCCLSERVQSSGLSSFHPMHVIFHYKLVRRMKRISEKLDELSEERKKLNWMRWFRREKVVSQRRKKWSYQVASNHLIIHH